MQQVGEARIVMTPEEREREGKGSPLTDDDPREPFASLADRCRNLVFVFRRAHRVPLTYFLFPSIGKWENSLSSCNNGDPLIAFRQLRFILLYYLDRRKAFPCYRYNTPPITVSLSGDCSNRCAIKTRVYVLRRFFSF